MRLCSNSAGKLKIEKNQMYEDEDNVESKFINMQNFKSDAKGQKL